MQKDQGDASDTPSAPADPKIRRLADAWQTILQNMVVGNGIDPADATSTMLAVAAFWRGELIGHDRASMELQHYADHQIDEHAGEMAALREAAEAVKH